MVFLMILGAILFIVSCLFIGWFIGDLIAALTSKDRKQWYYPFVLIILFGITAVLSIELIRTAGKRHKEEAEAKANSTYYENIARKPTTSVVG